ncbi:MAG: DNA repair protein RecO [bacterium]
MLHKTRGIALHSIKYSETSLITKVYTDAFGMQSYLLKGVRSPKSRLKPALFQPLALLDLVVYKKEQTTLQNVKEVRLAASYRTLTSDIRKSSIALFLTELVYKSIREEEPNPGLFTFLWNAFTLLDAAEGNFSSFHLLFAMKFCRYLGFQPQPNRSESNRFFHLREGSFFPVFHSAADCLDETESSWFLSLMQTDLEHQPMLVIPSGIRHRMLEKILSYYRFHLHGFQEIRSHKILHTVLS